MPRPAFAATLRTPAVLAFAAACGFGCPAALAQSQPTPGTPSIPFAGRAAITNPEVTYQYGHEFVTVTSPGNAPMTGVFPNARGPALTAQVNSAYRIARFEVTTEQYVQFLNALYATNAPAGRFIPVPAAGSWGARAVTGSPSGPVQFEVLPGGANVPVGGVNWRAAAIYCNWLHNDMALSPAAFASGAYDTSTFGYRGEQFTDQPARSPGARFFIPTWNEWAKAAHWDPNRFGDGQGGYWNYSNGTDVRPIPGLPPSMGGDGQANWGVFAGNSAVPVGAYTDQQSPWGLLDLAGGRREWTETLYQASAADPRFRIRDGSYSGQGFLDPTDWDLSHMYSILSPESSSSASGFRIAAVIPSPTTFALTGVGAGLVGRRRR
ncbi:MAG: SUMF1/EgtB/PvdO family nonheme iron enzyme [bacterium]